LKKEDNSKCDYGFRYVYGGNQANTSEGSLGGKIIRKTLVPGGESKRKTPTDQLQRQNFGEGSPKLIQKGRGEFMILIELVEWGSKKKETKTLKGGGIANEGYTV